MISNKKAGSIRILLAVNIPFPEGRANTRRIRSIGRELARQGHQVTLLIPFARKPQRAEQLFEGMHVRYCLIPRTEASFIKPSHRAKINVQLASRCLWLKEIWKESKKDNYDWLYLYQPGLDGWLAAVIGRLYGRRICSEYVDLLSPAGYQGLFWRCIYLFQLFADRRVPSISDQILVISSVLKKTYQGRHPRKPIFLFPTLVDTKLFGAGDRDRFRSLLALGDNPVVGFTGSFVSTEGLRLLFDVMRSIVLLHQDVKFIVAGGSLMADSDDAEELIRHYGLGENARFLGIVSETDVVDLLSASDILVMPKLDAPVNHAGLSTKLAEYLASGRAVVASSVGDVGKYLVHEQDALLVPPGNRSALEQAIARLIGDQGLRKMLGANGRKAAIKYFDIEANVARFVMLLRDMENGEYSDP